MTKHCFLFAVSLLAIDSHTAVAQLHLLTGSPFDGGTATYPSDLLRIEKDGSVSKAAQIVPDNVGTQWIGASYDWGKAVLIEWAVRYNVIVVDFEKAAISKKCRIPSPMERSLIYSWLADPVAPGPSYEWLETGTDVVKDAVVQGMVLDAEVPCERSFTTLQPEAIGNAVAHGQPGVAGQVNGDGVYAGVYDAETGNVTVGISGKHISLGYAVPSALRQGLQIRVQRMIVNNRHVFALTQGDGKDAYRVYIFRKSDKTWHLLPRVGEHHPGVRAFGRYLALVERNGKSPQHPTNGMKKWKSGEDRVRPDLRSLVNESDRSYPGKLHLYDVETERVWTIATDQGDSEILLVEGNTVYYRAADRLYSAPIGERTIGKAQLLAEDDAIRDAHWAFIKH